MFVPSFFSSPFFFFFFKSTLQGYSEFLHLVCFSLQYPCCLHTFFSHCYSSICVQLHIKPGLEFQCIIVVIQERQGNSRLQPSVYSPAHLLSLYHSCYPNTPSFFSRFKIYAFQLFLSKEELEIFHTLSYFKA